MALLRVSPTRFDRWVAENVSKHTNPGIEETAEVLTWGADEHVLLFAAAALWLATRSSNTAARRKLGKHLFVAAIAASVLPHIIKAEVDQERPDREAIAAHRKGIPFSGKRNDAFPSGHAMHMGALASAATLFPNTARNTVWGIAAFLSATRVAILAHWATDVFVGFAIGAGIERLLRRFTHPVPLASSRSRLKSAQSGKRKKGRSPFSQPTCD